MTMPNISFPTINPGQVIQDPGLGGTIADSLAGVLAAQQKQQEQQYKMQQLAQAQAQQQALAQYYQGTLAVQNREQTRLEGAQQQEQARLAQSSAQSLAGAQQRGQALDSYLGVPQPGMQPPGMPQQSMAPQPGNATQDPTAGLFKPILAGAQQSLAPAQGNPDVFGTSKAAGDMAAALQGVAPENVEGAIASIQATQPKPEELPTSGKEFQFLQHLAQVDPTGKAAQMYWQMVGPKPGVTVNNIPGKVETAYGVEGAKADVTDRTTALDQAGKAASSFPSMNEAYKLFQSGNVIAGLGAKQVVGIHRVLAAMGNDTSKLKVTDTQTATKLLRDGVLAQLQTRALGSGTAVSDADRNYMEQVQGADLTQQPDAIKRIIRINVGLSVEKLVSAKMLLQQQMESHPEASKDLQVKIKGVDQKLTPIWKSYQDMLKQEQDADAGFTEKLKAIPGFQLPSQP